MTCSLGARRGKTPQVVRAKALPVMADETAARLDHALAGTGPATAADHAELLAKRDALLALRAA